MQRKADTGKMHANFFRIDRFCAIKSDSARITGPIWQRDRGKAQQLLQQCQGVQNDLNSPPPSPLRLIDSSPSFTLYLNRMNELEMKTKNCLRERERKVAHGLIEGKTAFSLSLTFSSPFEELASYHPLRDILHTLALQ